MSAPFPPCLPASLTPPPLLLSLTLSFFFFIHPRPHLFSSLPPLLSQPQALNKQKKHTHPYAQGFLSPRKLSSLMQMPA